MLLAAVVGLAFSPGPMVFGSIGLFLPSLSQSYGWNRGEIMLALTIFNIAGVVAAPYTGRLLDQHGVRKVLFPSLLALAAGWAGWAWLSGSLTAFYVVAALWGAFTVGTQSISYTKLISGWFDRHRGLAIGIAAAGLGAGYTIMPLIAAWLLSFLGWQQAFIAMGALVVVPIVFNLFFSRPNPEAAARHAAADGLTMAQARSTREFVLIALSILLASAALTGVVPHVALFALDGGFDTAQAASVASVYGISTIIGRLVVGWLADRFAVPRVAAIFFAMSTIGFLLAGVYGEGASIGLLYVLALVIGFGFGAESDIIALLIVRYFGHRAFGAIYGYILSAFLIGASMGPPLFGFGHDYFGGYSIPMLIAAAVMVAAIALMLALPLQAGLASPRRGAVPKPSHA